MYGSQGTPDSPRTKLKSGYFSQAPEASRDTRTSIVSVWNSAERTRRYWIAYSFSISGVSGARAALKPVEWNEIGKWHSALASHSAYQSWCHSGIPMRLNARSPPRRPILAQRRTSAAADFGSLFGTIASGNTRLGSALRAKSATQSVYTESAQSRIVVSVIISLIMRQPYTTSAATPSLSRSVMRVSGVVGRGLAPRR